MSQIAWSIKITHTNKLVNGAPKIEAGVYDSHEEVVDLLNEKFETETPFTVSAISSIYKKGQKTMQMVNKRDGEKCEITLWNISGGK